MLVIFQMIGDFTLGIVFHVIVNAEILENFSVFKHVVNSNDHGMGDRDYCPVFPASHCQPVELSLSGMAQR